MTAASHPRVLSVGRSPAHGFHKPPVTVIRLLAGLGVEGDAHAGVTVRHRSRVAQDPTQPNLRQVHLLQAEIFEELAAGGFHLAPGDIGENVTTTGIDLLGLPRGTRLRLGAAAEVEITGLRNPCRQLDAFRPGLMAALLGRDAAGRVLRKGGVMAVVQEGGEVAPGDRIEVRLPSLPHARLDRV